MDTSKNFLFEYYLALQNDCIKSLSSIKEDFKRGDIHKFRVCVKKINAFKSLLNCLDSDENFVNERVKKIYKSAGKLRTNAILKNELNSLKISDKHLKEHLKSQNKKLKDKLENQISSDLKELKKIFKEDNVKLKFILSESCDIEKFSLKYVKNLFKKITEFESSYQKNISSLHDLRKLMKEAGYNYILICDAFYLLKSEPVIRSIDELNKILGKWHDMVVLLKFIHKNKLINSDRIMHQLSNDAAYIEKNVHSALEYFIINSAELKI